MEDFLTKKYHLKTEIYKDAYAQDMERRTKQSIALANMSLKTSVSQGEQQNTFQNRLSFITNTYSTIIVGVLNTAIWYPLSVKLVKRLFRVRGFLNIHLAICPIIFHANAIVLGALQGYINVSNFRNNYQTVSEANLKRDIFQQL